MQKKILAVLCAGLPLLTQGCLTPGERRAGALARKNAKLGLKPKSEYVRLYGNPLQCQLYLDGELCSFRSPSDSGGSDDPMWVRFDQDGYSKGRESAATY